MTALTKQDLAEIDKRIDTSIPSQKLLALPRDVALIHILRFFEDYVRLSGSIGSQEPEKYAAMLKNGQDGMHFAVQWIFQYCPNPAPKPQLVTLESVYHQAGELHQAAMNYSQVWDFMAMLHRGRVTGELDKDGIIHLRYPAGLADDFEVAARFMSDPVSPEIKKMVSSGLDFEPDTLLADVELRKAGERIKYRIPRSTFERVAESQRRTLAHSWELSGSWDLGGYTISQFREFWVALTTLCWIHHWVCIASGIQGGALDSVVKVLQRRRWENELARRSGLDTKTISAILDDLVYNPSLYGGEGKKKPDVAYQPFFPLNSELLALSNWLVLLSNAERNMWDLVSISRETLHASLRNQKESQWLQELTPQLASYGLEVYGPINYTYGGRRTDLDLLVLDSKAHFGIGCQLKWLTTPDRIRDVRYTDNELEGGLDQAAHSFEWLNLRPTELQVLTGLSADELATYEFKVMVLSKNTIGSAWVHRPNVPIVNERLLHWILGDPHRRRLRTLWHVGEERRYLPQRGKHFMDEDVVVEFGDVQFMGEGLGMTLRDPWDPVKDIDLSGLP